MFDAGVSEFILIMVIALLVVGPERLPGLVRKVGHFVGRARAYVNGVRSDIERELQADELRKILDQQRHEIRELKDFVNETQQEARSELEQSEYLVRAVEDTEPKTGTDEPQSAAVNPSPAEQEPPSPATTDDAKK